jgi:hypothetical protein
MLLLAQTNPGGCRMHDAGRSPGGDVRDGPASNPHMGRFAAEIISNGFQSLTKEFREWSIRKHEIRGVARAGSARLRWLFRVRRTIATRPEQLPQGQKRPTAQATTSSGRRHSAQAQLILGTARDIRDSTTPPSCKRLKRRTSVKVQE